MYAKIKALNGIVKIRSNKGLNLPTLTIDSEKGHAFEQMAEYTKYADAIVSLQSMKVLEITFPSMPKEPVDKSKEEKKPEPVDEKMDEEKKPEPVDEKMDEEKKPEPVDEKKPEETKEPVVPEPPVSSKRLEHIDSPKKTRDDRRKNKGQ